MLINVITGVLLTLASLFLAWWIRQQNRRDREYIKGIVREELHDALKENNLKLDQINANLEVLMDARESMNEKLMEQIFKNFK